MRFIGIARVLVVVFTLLATWYIAETFFSSTMEMKNIKRFLGENSEEKESQKKIHNKCRNEKTCPSGYFAFKIVSGAANVVGPSICFEDKIIMSGVRSNIGRGLNIALINATSGVVLKTGYFDMYSGDVKEVKDFLKPTQDGTFVLIASYDDPATKLDDETRDMFTGFGSSYAKKLGFRDSWIFLGGKGLKAKSPFEQHIKNDKETNKYDGWPEVIEMEGCVPQKKI